MSSNKQEQKRNKVLGQMKKVRDSGEVNMADAQGVQRVAYENDYHALVSAIGSNPFAGYTILLNEFEDYLEQQE